MPTTTSRSTTPRPTAPATAAPAPPQVAIVSAKRWALITELEGAPEPDLAEVVAWLGPCDLVIVEGYKSAAIPKIEVRRSAAFGSEPLAGKDPNVIAIAADHAADGHGRPVFALDDVAGIADFIAAARPARLRGRRAGEVVSDALRAILLHLIAATGFGLGRAGPGQEAAAAARPRSRRRRHRPHRHGHRLHGAGGGAAPGPGRRRRADRLGPGRQGQPAVRQEQGGTRPRVGRRRQRCSPAFWCSAGRALVPVRVDPARSRLAGARHRVRGADAGPCRGGADVGCRQGLGAVPPGRPRFKDVLFIVAAGDEGKDLDPSRSGRRRSACPMSSSWLRRRPMPQHAPPTSS